MNAHVRTWLVAAIASLPLASTAAQGQQPAPALTRPSTLTQPTNGPALVPLKVLVVVSRYQGEKRVSNFPYTLSVTANDEKRSSLRMGAQVPVSMPSALPGDAPGIRGPVTYKDIGTSIDCDAKSLNDGRFSIQVTINDTSVYADGQSAAGTAKLNDIPTFRSFSSNETVILRDGQTTQFTAAADKVSGEVTRVDVTLTVVK